VEATSGVVCEEFDWLAAGKGLDACKVWLLLMLLAMAAVVCL
jgi:hypothetical protein